MNKPIVSKTEVIIRSASVADAKAMSAIVHSYSNEFLASPESDEARIFLVSTSSDCFAKHIQSGNRKFFVAAISEAFIGFISLRDGSHINQFFVLADHRNKGIGTQLWHRVRAEAVSRSKCHTFTVKSSLHAVPVYERLGFIRIGDRTEERGLIFFPMALTINGPPIR